MLNFHPFPIDQLVEPYHYIYNMPVFSKDGNAPVYYRDMYQTDVIHRKALAVLESQRGADKPFFLWGTWWL